LVYGAWLDRSDALYGAKSPTTHRGTPCIFLILKVHQNWPNFSIPKIHQKQPNFFLPIQKLSYPIKPILWRQKSKPKRKGGRNQMKHKFRCWRFL
jgi:hypothetical protein